VPKISEEAKAERRERILAGARRCFADHGYEGATVARLEAATGLSRGAIFNWFGSKEDLFLELATRDNNRINAIWLEQGLEAAVRAILEEDREWLGVYLGVAHRLRTDAEFRRRWDERQPKEQQQAMIARMKDEQSSGTLRADLEPKEIGNFLGVVFDGLAVQLAAGYDPPVDVVLGLLRDALAPVTGRTRSRTPS